MIMNEKKRSMYFIAVVLPGHLDEKVLACKQWMKEKYGCKVGLKSPAHITIAPPFWMEEEKEAALCEEVATVAQTTPAFPLTTANFSAFKPRTIFVAVEDSEPLNVLKKNSDNHFCQKDYKIKIDTRPF